MILIGDRAADVAEEPQTPEHEHGVYATVTVCYTLYIIHIRVPCPRDRREVLRFIWFICSNI